jgi:DUF4097 and DUF4098 domain-containing protein YvlB
MMNRRRWSIFIGLVLGTATAVLLLAGSAHARPSNETREEFHQAYTLSANGRVELSNVNGSVNITGGEGTEVKVDAVKHARSAGALSECRIVVDARPDFIRIETKYPEHEGHYGNAASVDFTVRVPRGARLDKISVVNGELEIAGISGEVDGSSVNGSVRVNNVSGHIDLSSVNGSVEVEATAEDKDVRLHSVNGRVSLTLPSDTQSDISAKTVNGSIHNDFGLAVDKGRYVGSHLKGKLGSGGAHVELDTVNGSIDLHHANDGKPLSKPSGQPAHDEDSDEGQEPI